jgi:hypothetical protein
VNKYPAIMQFKFQTGWVPGIDAFDDVSKRNGETLTEIAKSYNVSYMTISRL